MNLINLNLLSSTVTTNPAAETLRQLQNNEISTSWNWSGFASKEKNAKKHQYPTIPDQYLPTPLERRENLWCNKIFTLVPRNSIRV